MAYPMLSIGYIVNTIAGYLFFHEVLNLFGYIPRRLRRINDIYCHYDTPPLGAGLFITTQMVGIVVIIMGIFLITQNG
jgi:multidrug transporter EmrE-like cation transporter